MKNFIGYFEKKYSKEIIELTSKLISIKSITGNEKDIINFIYKKMIKLGFDNVQIDKFGNVLGKVGSGEKTIIFDSHLDTVEEGIASEWIDNPFSGKIIGDKIYGRGSADMKAGFVASLYSAVVAKELNLLDNKTVYVIGSIMEEDYEGEALKYILQNQINNCDSVIICEPSSLKIARGHKGRALIQITTKGISAHGSAPNFGVNAIYSMIEILQKVEKLESNSCKTPDQGTIALTKIEVDSVSYNAIPGSCTIFLDRRITNKESKKDIIKQMDELVQGTNATWNFVIHDKKTWTGAAFKTEIYYHAWEQNEEQENINLMKEAYYSQIKDYPEIVLWNFSTNGVASAGLLKIPTVGFGPGNPELAHKTNEYCNISEIINAAAIYCSYINLLK